MPVTLERILKRAASNAGLQPGTERYNAYVYGTMRRIKESKNGKRKTGRNKK